MADKHENRAPRPGFIQRLLKAPGRFRRDETGAVIIEFAIVGPIFLAMIMVMLETGALYWTDRILQSHTSDVARRYRTAFIRQVSDVAPDGTAITRAEDLCRDRLPGLIFDCSKMLVDVRETGAVLPLIDNSGNLIPGNFAIAPGVSGTVNVVRVFYPWPRLFNLPIGDLGQATPKGDFLLRGAAGFVTE